MSMRLRDYNIRELFPYIELLSVAAAAALWYLFPELGPWPLILIGGIWISRLLLFKGLGPATTFELPLLIFFLTAAVSVWSAYDQEVAWGKFWLIVGGIALFYAFAHLLTDGPSRALEDSALLLAFFGAAVSLYFIMTHDWSSTPAEIGFITKLGQSLQLFGSELPGHRLNPNVAGGMIAVTIPFAGAAFILSKVNGHRLSSVLSALVMILLLVGLILSSSRTAWIGLVSVGFILAIFWLTGIVSKSQIGQRKLFFASLGVFALLAAGITVIWVASPSTIYQLLPFAQDDLDRSDFVRNGLILIGDYPLIGSGLGGFMMLYSTYSLLIHVGFTSHSHNLILNILLEQGLFALLMLVWMWLRMGIGVWQGMDQKYDEMELQRGDMTRAAPFPDWRYLLYAAALSLVIVVVHGILDDPLYGSRGVLLLFVPLAFAVPVLQSKKRFNPRRDLKITGLIVAIVIVLGLVFWRPLLSRAL